MSKIVREILRSEDTRAICLVKPHAVREGLLPQIKKAIEDSGLKVAGETRLELNQGLALSLYKGHMGKDYFPWLIEQVTSGEIVALLVEGENAPRVIRDLAGKTKPEDARIKTPDSIRALLTRPDETFARSREEGRAVDNVVHTSDPDEKEAVVREGMIFFPCRFG